MRRPTVARSLARLALPSVLALQACTSTSGSLPPNLRTTARIVRPPAIAPVKPVSFEEPDRIKIEYGSRCGQSDQPGEEAVIEFDGSMSVPSYATAATVALGWKFRYLNDDNHVGSVGVRIVDVSHDGPVLR